MSRIIKDFDSFSDNNVNESWEDFGNFFTNIFGFAGEGLRKTIKQKVAAKLMEQIGVKENSNMSAIVQEVIDQIPISDYPKLLSGENANVEYLAPVLAKSLQEFIQRKGLDSLAEQMGIEPTGWLYSTLREGLQSERGRAIIENALVEAFGGPNAKGSLGMEAISDLDSRDKQELVNAARNKAAQIHGKPNTVAQQGQNKGMGDYLSSFWHSLVGDNKGQTT